MNSTSPNIVFVFGSNLAGRHGKGAAWYAMKHFGAVYGEGVGRTGRAYAIPTKDKELKSLPLDKIEDYISDFIDYAFKHPDTMFIFTALGTGLAGYEPSDIGNIMSMYHIPENVYISAKLFGHVE